MIKICHDILHLSLRELNLTDAEELHALINHNRDFLKKYLGWLDKTTKLEDAEAFIASCQERNKTKSALNFGIYSDDKLIGMIGFHEIDIINQTSSIGYWLAESYQGNGIMRSAVISLIEHAIHELALEKITIRVAINNPRSQNIPKSLGFKAFEIKKNGETLNGESVDQIVFTMTKEEWQRKAEVKCSPAAS